jgi:DNA helicase-2/ATP-dependent DNA helicase PcrA
VHQAKGLEWRAVFGLWLVDGKLPDLRALKEPDGEEEERRLFYVLCTRAKDRLFLVHPVVGLERGLGVTQRASRFLTELDPKTYEEVRAGYEPRYRDEEEEPEEADPYAADEDPYKDGYA